MDDSLISLFIDDELDLGEKIIFVETVHSSREFSLEAVALLEQEKRLRDLPARMPVLEPQSVWVGLPVKEISSRSWSFRSWWQPMAGFVAATLLIGIGFLLMPRQSTLLVAQAEQRFVLYLPQASQAKIIGTFTDWNPVPMKKIGTSGYWSLTLKVPQGEHRYSYLIEEDGRMVDPTVAAREHDDFGGENTVIVVGGGDAPLS
ncbi:MAG: glycogen-binding domain-containing protein [Proteobacteria bacterium]|nr:glycogen-binding domain-containing protein [Pseudomonadota bacterium]